MLAAGAEEEEMDTEEFLDMVASFSPNGRIATPEDIAGLIVFVVSDAARQINGAVLTIDGGLTA